MKLEMQILVRHTKIIFSYNMSIVQRVKLFEMNIIYKRFIQLYYVVQLRLATQ